MAKPNTSKIPRSPPSQQQPKSSNNPKEKFWHSKTGRTLITVLGTIIVAIIAVIGVVFIPPLNHIINPEPIVSSTTFEIPSGSPYFYCVEWQQKESYEVGIETNEIPIDLFIVNESTRNQYYNNLSLPANLVLYSDENTMRDTFSYLPPVSGRYYIVVVNGAAFKLSKNYQNQSAIVTLTVEKYKDTCPP